MNRIWRHAAACFEIGLQWALNQEQGRAKTISEMLCDICGFAERTDQG